jgi:hypothetical protein
MVPGRSWLFVLVLALGCGRDEPPAAPAPSPTAAEVTTLTRALEPRLAPPPGGWRAQRDVRGRERLSLAGRFQGMTLATPAADGSLRVQCVSSAAEARAFLTAAPAAEGSPR